jgi:hypothetical protein
MQRIPRAVVAHLTLALALCWVDPSLGQLSDVPDAEIEQCLAEAKVGKKAGKVVGVTRPEHLGIDCPGVVDSVLFKHHDEHRPGVTRLASGETELNFSDSYKYERAAYLLDRELGMNMVPVAVLRQVKGDDGALVAMIPDAVHESEMEGKPKGLQMVQLLQQKAVMRLFDALIYNIDRRPANWMVSQDDWSLYLIDHSRAFRELKELPKSFTDDKVWLSQELYERLGALDRAQLTELLDGLVTAAQVDSMLARRDLIVERIEHERAAQGDDTVFFK